MFNPFNLFRRITTWLSEGISFKAKIILVLFVFLFIVGAGFVAYKINDHQATHRGQWL
jgi:hypothetical protein